MSLRDIVPSWHKGEMEDWPGTRSPMRQLHREMDRLFDRFFEEVPGLWGTDGAGRLMPAIDLSETDKEIEITVDLPGLDEKDLDINLADGVLTIKGEKKSEKEEKGKEFHRIERSSGTYYRAVRLPSEVDESKVSARFTKGVLTVHLPKTETAQKKVRKIEVKAA